MNAPRPKDVLYPHEPYTNGRGFQGVRVRDGRVTGVSARPSVDGAPVPPGGSIVETRPLPDGRGYEVTNVLYEAPGAAEHPGPARVSSDAYRDGWNAVWGGRKPDPTGELN